MGTTNITLLLNTTLHEPLSYMVFLILCKELINFLEI